MFLNGVGLFALQDTRFSTCLCAVVTLLFAAKSIVFRGISAVLGILIFQHCFLVVLHVGIALVETADRALGVGGMQRGNHEIAGKEETGGGSIGV